MIYLDTSVALAELLGEGRRPDAGIWNQPLISSRLLEYEVWVRLHAYKLAAAHGERARQLLGRVSFIELSPVALGRALDAFPAPVRTLDALHLSSLLYVRERRTDVSLATFDEQMRTAARKLKIPVVS